MSDTLAGILEGRIALPGGVTTETFLNDFGRGFDLSRGKVPFGHSGHQDGFLKSSIGAMFDRLELDKEQRNELWSIIGHPNKPYHKTKKDDTWGVYPEVDRVRLDTRAHKTPYELFKILIEMRVINDTINDAIKLALAVATSFEVLWSGYHDGDYMSKTGHPNDCKLCRGYRDYDELIVHYLMKHIVG